MFTTCMDPARVVLVDLQRAYAYGLMVVLGRGGLPSERGTPVCTACDELGATGGPLYRGTPHIRKHALGLLPGRTRAGSRRAMRTPAEVSRSVFRGAKPAIWPCLSYMCYVRSTATSKTGRPDITECIY